MKTKRIHLLSIEDRAADATLIREVLEDATRLGWNLPDFEITHVSRVRDGLDRLDAVDGQAPIDVVLTDLDLPDSRAEETFTRIHAYAPGVPIVVLTGRDDEALARQTVRDGAEDYLFKREMNGSLLAHALIYAIERQQHKRALQASHALLEKRVEARTADLEAEIAERQSMDRERKRAMAALRESERRFREIFEASPIGIELYDPQGRLLDVNEAGRAIFGLANVADVKGFKLFEDPNLPVEAKERMLRGETVHYESVFDFKRVQSLDLYRTTRSGPINLDVKITALGDPHAQRLSGYLVQVQDITDRKEAESAIRRYAADLEQSNRELKEIARAISHDLQEPLWVVKAYLELFLERYRAALDDRAAQFIDHAVESATHMQTMVRALHHLSEIEAADRNSAPTDVESVLNRALQALAQEIEATGAEITYDPMPTVMADALQLRQVFQHLLANALIYHREGIPPRVHVSAVRLPSHRSPRSGEDEASHPRETGGKGQQWAFSVRDNGIGIDPSQTDRLFQVFQRLHPRDGYPGMGLGLALCKRIVTRHGGRIWVASEPGAGATFTFTLQASRERSRL
jgi:PAS domain S-box-containing protein